jgi:uncharacterized membrane protein YfcA
MAEQPEPPRLPEAPGGSAGVVRYASHGDSLWRVAGIGIVAGVLSGLFGVGGGIIMVPLLVAWAALDQRRASATSLLAIVPIATASAAGYAATGSIDLVAGLLLLVGGVLGGQVGTRLLPGTPIPRLQLWFGLLSLVAAARLVLGGPGSASAVAGSWWEAILLVVVGIAAGLLAGLLGVGGGIVMVPGLVILAGSDADTARGTSLLVVVFTALTATVTNLRNELVDVRVALTAGLVGIPAGLAGAALGQWLPERVALGLFAALLTVSGIRMILRSRVPAGAASPAA